MKNNLIILIMILFPYVVKSQEIKIVSSVLPSGGNIIRTKSNFIGEKEISLSKWRIGVIHQLILDVQPPDLRQVTDGQIFAYPNPVINKLHLRFSFPQKEDFIIEVSDNLGKRLLTTIIRQIVNGDVVQIDLSNLTKGLYMVNVLKSDKTSCRSFKIIKN